MKNKIEKDDVKFSTKEVKPLSANQVIKEIGNAVIKEKTRRERAKRSDEVKALSLGEDIMVKAGVSKFDAPMPPDLATLKSLIQTVVRDELGRDRED